MKAVQKALEGIVPVFVGVWKPTGAGEALPDNYVVYTTMTTESGHCDDEAQFLTTYVYMNLWSKADPTPWARKIRRAMRAAGFAMDEERSNSTKSDDGYASSVKAYGINWTWVYLECVNDEY